MLTQIGKYSYGIYVYHVFVLFGFEWFWERTAAYIHPTRLFSNCAILLVTFMVAKASYDLYESKFLKLKNRFSPQY